MRRTEDWIKQAERDLEEARYSKLGGYFELTCFLSQQAAEKAVKGLLHHRGIERRGHSISHLLENPPPDIHQCTTFLDKQYAPSRYPDVYEEGSPYEYYTEKDADECINCANRILEWVKGQVWK
ncbi:HEPN domain-containing protein [Metallosphaera hakonensis]|uniref:HEPN domain-containing protein n=1 Tax=Metallosphaera hakonensis JCM 8857 = DSM 7519 TaxID=1293036 RepID=A0A2U9IW96_9CREN|nr:HEPN domain-containing protein [Metallosphaera hakonensis]AWS00351.1 HEPN domain-containing protein [Metallosphaera hakonensis JCM 8857 = DSM 7519]